MIDFIQSLDTSVLHALYELRTPVWTVVFGLLTQLGSDSVIIIVAVSAMFALGRREMWNDIAGLALSIGVALALVNIVKFVVDRARPDLAFQAITQTGPAFPSAHATVAVACYGFLLHLVWTFEPQRWKRVAWTIFLISLILVIGFSRLYLGVHYLSDVIAGYVLGAACLALALWIMRKLQRDRMRV